ncbi:MAG: hypothetical protein PUD93_00255, partial [Lachnospiraceae bacterium]|nr:hypothetical protein [Lachnospiraceae bacterium]
QKQLQYFFTYQSLLTLVPVFQTLLQEKTMPAGEIKKLFLEECQFPAIQDAFAHTKIGDIKGSRNKIYAFCIRHKLYGVFTAFL